ncbi:MAG: hypothetical protein DI537_17525 [Stutzerimonas stutzeri]|nr:MAG: hypothetical protein DI537_17525 [Stutzerimonas stutzeri]
MNDTKNLTHLLTMRIRNFPGYSVDVCLRILAGGVVARSDGSRYRKVRAIAHDGREYSGWVASTSNNPRILPRVAALQIGLFIANRRVTFEYRSSTEIPDLNDPSRRAQTHRAPQPTAPASDALWGHLNALIHAIPVESSADASRIRKAVGLMFHSQANTDKIACDVLARANALIDSLSQQQAA